MNSQNNYTIKISEIITIKNNILGYEPKIKILSFPDPSTSGIYLYNPNFNYKEIYENETLDITDSIFFCYLNSSLLNNILSLEFLSISKMPSSYQNYDSFSDDIEIFGEKISHENDYLNNIEQFECETKIINFEIEISHDELEVCEPSCKICKNNQCLSCIDTSQFPAELKNSCYSNIPGDEYYFNEAINKYLL